MSRHKHALVCTSAVYTTHPPCYRAKNNIPPLVDVFEQHAACGPGVLRGAVVLHLLSDSIVPLEVCRYVTLLLALLVLSVWQLNWGVGQAC